MSEPSSLVADVPIWRPPPCLTCRRPTLLIVGGEDTTVIELNQQAFGILQCEKKVVIVPGATHLFEEAGALEQVERLAAEWYRRHR